MRTPVRLRVPLPAHIHTAYRTYASLSAKRLKDVQTLAINTFLDERAKELGRTEHSYFAAPRETKSVTVVLDSGLARRITSIADADRVSGRMLIYSALVQYHTSTIDPLLRRHGLSGLSAQAV